MLPFELLFRDIKNIELTTLQNISTKFKLLDTAFTSCNCFKEKLPVSILNEAELNT